jgi:multiple sugar transport system ATP-binding protein
MIELKGLAKSFDAIVAVADLDLKVGEGELAILLGPSGCGKTTTLRMIAGLEEPSAGDILFDGKSVVGWSPKERGVAMVFQDYGLYPHMTARDNIAFPLKLSHLPKPEVEGRTRAVMSRLGIVNLAARRPSRLSGGERQRVGLARALVREPRVMLMDEPLSNLDAMLRIQLREEIQILHHDLHMTTFYVTHDQVEALSLGTLIAVMDRGRILQVGTPWTIYHEPESLFVARFVGSPPMNCLNLALDGDSEDMLVGPDLKIQVPKAVADELRQELSGPDVVVGVRPEHLALGPIEKAQFRGQIRVVEPLGPDYFIHITIGDARLMARIEPDSKIAVGDSIGLNPRRLYFFDAATGRRVGIANPAASNGRLS